MVNDVEFTGFRLSGFKRKVKATTTTTLRKPISRDVVKVDNKMRALIERHKREKGEMYRLLIKENN